MHCSENGVVWGTVKCSAAVTVHCRTAEATILHCTDTAVSLQCTDTAVTRQDCRPAGQGGEQTGEDFNEL